MKNLFMFRGGMEFKIKLVFVTGGIGVGWEGFVKWGWKG